MEILFLGGLALVLGFILAISSALMAVEKDERVEAIADILPGINCGACGFSGCLNYAEALVAKKTQNGLCPPGGQACSEAVAQIMGEEAAIIQRKIAVLMCQGHNCNRKSKLIYDGLATCEGANLLYGGNRDCQYGCLGCGDCAASCPEGAIAIIDGLALIKSRRCIGCGICQKHCPKDLLEVIPDRFTHHVKCRNKDRGALARKVCQVSCIGCFKCTKVCAAQAISVKDHVATIDYNRCTNCGLCKDACPTSAIT